MRCVSDILTTRIHLFKKNNTFASDLNNSFFCTLGGSEGNQDSCLYNTHPHFLHDSRPCHSLLLQGSNPSLSLVNLVNYIYIVVIYIYIYSFLLSCFWSYWLKPLHLSACSVFLNMNLHTKQTKPKKIRPFLHKFSNQIFVRCDEQRQTFYQWCQEQEQILSRRFCQQVLSTQSCMRNERIE